MICDFAPDAPCEVNDKAQTRANIEQRSSLLHLKPILTATLIAFAGITAPMAALAELPASAEAVTDEQVDAFVKTAIALEQLRKQYTQKIANAESEEEQAKLKDEADEVAIQLVERVRGISPDEYLVIGKFSQESVELSTRIAAQLDVMRERKAEFEKKKAEEALRAAEPAGE